MRKKIFEELAVPSGISVSFENGLLTASKGSESISRQFDLPNVSLQLNGDKILIGSEKANKNELKQIRSTIAHIKNLFRGLNEKFVYQLEACNVHFPMTLKSEQGFLIINNFLGEKVPRKAKILPGVNLEIKGPKITVSSTDIEAAGKTATNIEKATKIRNRDRRIFQDGIFIVQKPEAKK